MTQLLLPLVFRGARPSLRRRRMRDVNDLAAAARRGGAERLPVCDDACLATLLCSAVLAAAPAAHDQPLAKDLATCGP